MMTTLISFIKTYFGLILFLVSLCVGLNIYDKFGVSWDEMYQHELGEVTYNYIFKNDDALKTCNYNDYGVAFEFPLILIEKILQLEDSKSIYLMRHFVTHLFFLINAFVCFVLIKYLYKSNVLATIGFLMLVINPRIYTDSFYNTKDIPFMAMFFTCFLLFAIAFKSKKIIHFVLLGVSCALLTNLRIMGVIIVCSIACFLLIDYFNAKNDLLVTRKKIFYVMCAFSLAYLSTLYITWPYLWENPLKNFAIAFLNMSRFRWTGEVLFFGRMVDATKLDWYYIPGWFSVTNPIGYLVTGFAGVILLAVKFMKKPVYFLQNNFDRNNVLYGICFIGPVFTVIVLKSVLYDGWRQLFFIYPAFIMLSVTVLNLLLNSKFRYFLLTLFSISILSSFYFMVKNFPHGNVYFNEFMAYEKDEYLRKNMEMDYWCLSHRKALEYILEKDSSATIKVCSEMGYWNAFLLNPNQRRRIKFVDEKEASYFVTNYREHPQDYAFASDALFYKITVLNSSIISVFKLK